MKKLAVFLVLLIILAVGVVAGGYYVLKSGYGGVDNWVVARVTRIAETYIVPGIDFDDFEWDGGRTITLKGVTLTDDGTEVVRAGEMVIVTERVPINGGPFIIEGITLKDATLRLIQTTGDDGGIAFKGLVPFMKVNNIKNQEQVDEEVKLSETFQIRKIALINGGFEYDAGDDSKPMILKGLTLDVDLTPESSGAYTLSADLGRENIFDMAVRGDLDLDAMNLANMDITFDADLSSPEAVSALPPQLQSQLRKYEVKGQVRSKVTGDLSLQDPTTSTINANIHLTDSNVSVGEYKFPVTSMRVNANVASMRLTVPDFDIQMLGGNISLDRFNVDLSAEDMPLDLAWDLRGLDIQQLLRAKPTEGKPPKFAGILATSGEVTGAATSLPDSLHGSGTLTLRKGRLVSIPVVSDLVDAMDVVAALTGTVANKDKADITFKIDGEGIEMPKEGLDLKTQVMSVRGKGRINFDQTLNLVVNGGPVEKLQDQLGEIGNILGMVTDGLVKYVIKGNVDDPKIEIKPLGIGS